MTHYLLFFTKCLALLPLPALRFLASVAGYVLYVCVPSLRKTVAANLAQAQLHLNVRAVIQANARGAADMVWVWFNPQAAVAARCTVADAAAMANARGLASGIILLTPHLGCFEALAKWWTVDAPMTAMYRRPDKAWLARFIETARVAPQLQMAPADANGVRSVLKSLKNNVTVGILPDQAPRAGEGVWTLWFGRLAYTITLPAKLHLSTQKPVYVFAALPTPRGWSMVCEPIHIDDAQRSDATVLTAYLNVAIERMVLQAPQHYAWSYRRYKGTPPAAIAP